jgi:hypothetical protein
MKARMYTLLLIAGSGAALCLAPSPAFAYVGPGAGVSLIGAAFGLIAAVVSAIGFVLLWPIRALLKKRRAARKADEPAAADAPSAGDRGPTA